MKTDSNSRTKKRAEEHILAAIKGSVIISALDRFCLKIYDLLCSGMFAWLFSHERRTSSTDSIRQKPRGRIERVKDRLSERIENSKIVNAVTRLSGRAVCLRLHIVGTYLMSFAAYTILFALIAGFMNNNVAGRYAMYLRAIEALTLAALSIPFLASKKTVSEAVCSSRICRFIVNSCGFSTDKLSVSGKSGKFAPAFVLGLLSGAASLVISPLYILCAIAAVIYLYIILSTPEFGLLSLFFLMPFLPTMVLVGLTLFTDIAFFIKLIRRKRVLHFDRLDLIALIFAALMLIGGFVSLSPRGSLPPALVYVAFMSVFFQLSCCVRSEKWLTKCLTALIVSGLITAFYGIIQYVLGNTMTSAWIDANLFEGIDGRATSTLENPNMFGEYLIMIMPIACSMWMAGIGVRRKNSFCAFACMAMALILTWSRGAWLGFLFSFAALLLIWNRRSIWIFLCGIAALPIASVVLPSTIVSRFTSIGNLADTSTSYRLSIWRGAVHMLRDVFLSGIGVGNAAWKRIYFNYSLVGITRADHSHNLFLQTAIDLGLPGILVFLILMVLLARCAFTAFRHSSGLPTEENSSMTQYQHKMAIAGPLCGIFAVLIQGLTDYSWYNYRVYLMFWLIAGLIPALAKNARRAADAGTAETLENGTDTASADIKLSDGEM